MRIRHSAAEQNPAMTSRFLGPNKLLVLVRKRRYEDLAQVMNPGLIGPRLQRPWAWSIARASKGSVEIRGHFLAFHPQSHNQPGYRALWSWTQMEETSEVHQRLVKGMPAEHFERAKISVSSIYPRQLIMMLTCLQYHHDIFHHHSALGASGRSYALLVRNSLPTDQSKHRKP